MSQQALVVIPLPAVKLQLTGKLGLRQTPSPSLLHSAKTGGGEAIHVKMKTKRESMKIARFLTITIALVISLIIVTQGRQAKAESLEDIERLLAETQLMFDAQKNATDYLEVEVDKLRGQLKTIQAQINGKENEVLKLETDIEEREGRIKSQYVILASKVRDYYKKSRLFSPFLVFASARSAGELTRNLAYKEVSADEDKNLIVSITSDIIQLEADKVQIEKDRQILAGLQAKLDKQQDFFASEIAKSKKYQEELLGQIASLTAKQQAILSEKSGTFQTTVGDVPLADDPASRPDYNPGFSPAFAAFSFGAPHFKGMSQYGALGRAKSGQDYQTILKAYYGSGIEVKDHDQNSQITVEGYGAYSLEEYAKRIYEVPNSWGDSGGMEALKAQAVAARSYALARGGFICATEACQVFKPEAKGGNWEKAVNETAGKVVYANGSPFSTWYASTSGGYQESYSGNGYSTPGFWDTPSGRNGWTSQAYEKTAGSPWFYKAWYKTRGGDNCGRSHPWLNSEEMADILNAWVVLYQGGGDSGRVTPESECWGGNPYGKGELAGIGGFTSVSSVSVQYSEGGTTANVTFQTNKGAKTIDGNEFYKAFNLRAPGRISLKSGLYNIEKK